MNLFKYALALSAVLPCTSAYWKGFNIKSNLADGTTCKSATDWAQDFATMKTFPNNINSARLYSSYSCNTLANAVPAAIKSKTYLLVGIDAENNYEYEKGALLSVVKQYGFSWMVAVSVGSEDLYRGTTNASTFANQIYDVRGMLDTVSGFSSSGIKVGHVDTSNEWENSANVPVIRACDFIGMDCYPYFQATQNNNISNAENLLYQGLQNVENAVTKAGSSASVWITETGWPTVGPTKGMAVASTANAKTYWDDVACSAFGQKNTFWFTLQDFNANPSFAAVDGNFNELYDMSC